MDEIMSRPNAPYYAKAGIDFTDWGTGAMNPDDRIIATAMLNGCLVVTGDHHFREYGIETMQ